MLQVEIDVSFEFSDVELDQMMSMLERKEEAMRKLAAKNVVKVVCEVGESHLKDSDAMKTIMIVFVILRQNDHFETFALQFH